MDSRGARGGETEAMDRRGQDHARYAKVTSDVKKGHKRKANVTRCHICERRSAICATPAAQQQRGCHLPACCRKVNGSQSQGLEGGERGREGCPHKRAGPRPRGRSEVSATLEM